MLQSAEQLAPVFVYLGVLFFFARRFAQLIDTPPRDNYQRLTVVSLITMGGTACAFAFGFLLRMSENAAVQAFFPGSALNPEVPLAALAIIVVVIGFADGVAFTPHTTGISRTDAAHAEDARLTRPTNSTDDYTPAERSYING